MHGDGGFPLWWFLWMAFITGALVYSFIAGKRRDRELLALAHRIGMQPLAGLPRDLGLARTELEGAVARNIWETQRAGLRVLVFDVRIGHGKGSWHRTVLAARTFQDVFAGGLYGRNFITKLAGEWLIMYEPRAGHFRLTRGTLPVLEIAAHLDAIGTQEAATTSAM